MRCVCQTETFTARTDDGYEVTVECDATGDYRLRTDGLLTTQPNNDEFLRYRLHECKWHAVHKRGVAA